MVGPLTQPPGPEACLGSKEMDSCDLGTLVSLGRVPVEKRSHVDEGLCPLQGWVAVHRLVRKDPGDVPEEHKKEGTERTKDHLPWKTRGVPNAGRCLSLGSSSSSVLKDPCQVPQ